MKGEQETIFLESKQVGRADQNKQSREETTNGSNDFCKDNKKQMERR